MTNKQRFNLIKERVENHNRICGSQYVCIADSTDVEIRPATDKDISGSLVKDIVALALAYQWCFGVYVNKDQAACIRIF